MNTHFLREGEKAALHGIFKLVGLGIIKIIAGLLTGMTVIIADAISTFADTLGIFASYIGLRLSRKSADEHFKYGYYKIETFAALVISIGIIYLGYYIFRESIKTFMEPKQANFYTVGMIATIIAIISSYLLWKKLQAAGEKANSLSLIASAKDKKMDMIAGGAVLISIIANYQNIPYVEGIVSIIISLIILKVGITCSKESLFFLLDYWNDPILTRKINKVFNAEHDLIIKVRRLRLRRAGTFIFGEAYVDINPYAGIVDLREELNILQDKIKKLNPYIKDFAIYSNIPKTKKARIAIPIKRGRGMNATVASTLSETIGYLFVDLKDEKIARHYFRSLKKSQKNPVQLSNFIKKEKVNILIDNNLNSLIYYYLRRTHHVFIYPHFADIKNAKKTVELLLIDT